MGYRREDQQTQSSVLRETVSTLFLHSAYVVVILQ
jgi:hypothetical protein